MVCSFTIKRRSVTSHFYATTSCKNVETLSRKNNLSCFKSMLLTGLWDKILTSLLPPFKVFSSKVEHGLVLLATLKRGGGGVTSTRSWTGHLSQNTVQCLSTFATGCSKTSGSQYSFLTEMAICIVERRKKSVGYRFFLECNRAQESHNVNSFVFFSVMVCSESRPWLHDVTTSPTELLRQATTSYLVQIIRITVERIYNVLLTLAEARFSASSLRLVAGKNTTLSMVWISSSCTTQRIRRDVNNSSAVLSENGDKWQ